MLTIENPICEERFYLDAWKPAANQQPMADDDAEQTWRRLSSNDSFDEPSVWSPPTSTVDNGFNMTKGIPDSAANWKDKPVEQWSADEVTLWICSLMNGQPQSPFDNNSYCPPINVAAYLNLTGAELLHMSNTDIVARDPQSGSFVFLSLQNYLSQTNNRYNVSSTVMPSYTHMENVRRESNMHTQLAASENQPHRPEYIKQEPVTKEFHQPRLPSLDLKLISFDIDDHFDSIKSLAKDITNVDMLVRNIHALRCPDKQRSSMYHDQNVNPALHNHTNGFNVFHHPMAMPPMKGWGELMPQTSSPMISPGSDGSGSPGEDLTRDFNGSYYQNEVKGNHLWEFIRDLLFDSRYNPSLVKWEDREEGVFKFVKSDQVAKLWGKKKNNPAMTYEKLSRAMRYYYRRKILERIDGRRLVYKFGSTATGWKA